MTVDGTAPRAIRQGPVALADLLEGALKELTPDPGVTAPAPGDGFLFSGNRHETVPRRLFLDRRLTPLERNAWQVFRLLLNDDGVTAFPTYEQLRPWLASMPCAGQASHETVARALTLLRLTRWLSLVRRRRDPKTGRILGNLYVLHDEPLTPFESMQLDADYLALVSQSLSHSAKAVQMVGLNTLQEIAEDPLLSGRTLPSRLQVLAERLARQGITASESYAQDATAHDSEEGDASLLRNTERPSSDSEAGLKPAPDGSLRNPKNDSTVRSSRINEVRTTARAHALGDLQWPKRFAELKAEQQAGVRMALQQVDEPMRQAVLDEWEARCRGSSIRNPAGYLFGIVQRAIRGEFNAWAGQAKPAEPPAPVQPPEPRNVVSPEVARQHIERLRGLLGKS
ncbi:STY4528 family pathogenicity island replication protein [Stenotrophomonas sp. NLF4-10]|uniref:STY4528 family pathogenicity island replication protein n=1 Tax=Stenotrophomonas sp. NLF4-10 TaxID=2918754 RepID=UPI001EFA5AB6|nr:STY4528 family pathogenicity island replication protein [Stenotrophomonas sp. NLF4-10]MCG8277410.1 STY4528 family pathogenicity island replication protein [Stenotrophomonas sp. NLF4-10]